MRKNELCSIVENTTFENIEQEGINVDGRKVTMTDKHEKLVNTSLINNPTCTKDIIPRIEVWSLFQRKVGGLNDGNPLLYALKGEKDYELTNQEFVYKRIEDLCELFIQKHPNMSATIAVPSTNPLNKYFTSLYKRKSNNTMVIDNLFVKMSVEEVDDYIYKKDSAFRKKYGAQYEQKHQMFEHYCSAMEDGIFRLHLIKDIEMRKVIDRTIKLEDKFYGTYMSAINGKDILILDDSITTGQSLREVYQIIADCYEPKSITILTLMSPKYTEDGTKLKDFKTIKESELQRLIQESIKKVLNII